MGGVDDSGEQGGGAAFQGGTAPDGTPDGALPLPPAPAPPPNPGDAGNPPAPTGGPVNLTGLTKETAEEVGIAVGPVPGGAGATGADADAGSRTAVAIKPYSVDQTREMIAKLLLAALFGIIAVEALISSILAFDCWLYGQCTARAAPAVALIANTIQPMFTAMIGLVGSVVGFYFGSQKS